ncbi:MAG: NAD-dependent deacylase [Spirochaetes bacterium]|nr:NAD-dependent deacylase [Spirochaetota bacterium]
MAFLESEIELATKRIRESLWLTVFTGAGISVESGIPPFRGQGGVWNQYNPEVLEISYFRAHPKESWKVIRDVFFEKFRLAKPNDAHTILATWEQRGLVKALITQNIDNLHHRAGSQKVIEYHGNSRCLRCLACDRTYTVDSVSLVTLPPACSSCGGLLKPDFVFFGEAIPPDALRESFQMMERTDCLIVIGTTGEVYPAADLPRLAKTNGAFILEINPEPSAFTFSLTDLYLPLSASIALAQIEERLQKGI